MEWQLAILFFMGGLILLMFSGMPVAFCFMLINAIGVYLFFGGITGLEHFTVSVFDSVTIFGFLPVPLFILMGEVMFRSGIAPLMMDALDKWLGRVPGRLGLLAVGGGTLFSTLTGTNMATIAVLGSTLAPEMEKRGYKKSMSLGPILGSGGLAIMIPPSELAVILGAIGLISIAKILMGIILPGLMLAALYATYIIIRCKLQPSLAPPYTVPPVPISKRLIATIRYVLPVGVIIFLVVGVILLGIATPTEAGATGTLGIFALAAAFRKLNWEVVKTSFRHSLQVTVMVFMIIAGASLFSQNLASSGATRGLIEFTVGLPISPILILIAMQVIIMVLGMFMEAVSIMMVAIPLFMPVIYNLGFNPVWFAVIMLLNIDMGTISPPFGLSLFVMKGVAPPDTTMGDIYKASLPFLGLDLIVMALIIAFPAIVLWLPSVLH